MAIPSSPPAWAFRSPARARAAAARPTQVKAEQVSEPAPQAASVRDASGRGKKDGPSPSTLRHAAKKAEETMSRLAADLARIDDDLANAALNNPKALEGLSRARTKAQADLDSAEQAWIDAEEALAETVS